MELRIVTMVLTKLIVFVPRIIVNAVIANLEQIVCRPTYAFQVQKLAKKETIIALKK